jgi:hypothetical protein
METAPEPLPNQCQVTRRGCGRSIVDYDLCCAMYLNIHFVGEVEVNDVRTDGAVEARRYS